MPVLRNNLESLYIPFLFFPPVKALRACPLPEHITQRRIKEDYRMDTNSQMLTSWSMPLGYKYYLHNQLFTPFSADSEIATKSTAYQMVSAVPWPNYSITMNSYLLFCTAVVALRFWCTRISCNVLGRLLSLDLDRTSPVPTYNYVYVHTHTAFETQDSKLERTWCFHWVIQGLAPTAMKRIFYL